MIFGRLYIMYSFKKNHYKMAHCMCSCGNETDVFYSNLTSGRTKSCGCLEKENRQKYKDLSNQHFGKLTAISPTKERMGGSVVWLCKCSCGNIVKKSSHALLRGDVQSCGCLRKFTKTKYDLTNQSNEHFTILSPLDKKMTWKTKWRCQCKCGTMFNASFSNLYYGHTKSCGCLKALEYRTLVDGTIVECLSHKPNKNNTSGIKGVYRSRNRWVAYLTFKGKHYHLGAYEDIEDARLARLQAEQKYFVPLLEQKAREKKKKQMKN